MPHGPIHVRSVPTALLLVLAVSSSAAASPAEIQSPAEEASAWPTAAELRATLVQLGYEFRADGLSSPWSGTGFWTGARADLTDVPVTAVTRWLRVDPPDGAAATVWLVLADDDRITELHDVGSALGVPRSALDEASALVRVSSEWRDGPECPYFEWEAPGGRMVLWRDRPAGDRDFAIAFEPWPAGGPPSAGAAATEVVPASAAVPDSATEACGAMLAIEAGDLWFRPAEVTVASAGTTTIRLDNAGRVAHNVRVDELDVLVVAGARSTGEAMLVDPSPGVYEFYCSISGHREAGMVGTLTVE